MDGKIIKQYVFQSIINTIYKDIIQVMYTNTPTPRIGIPTPHPHTAGTPTIDELRRRIEVRHSEQAKKANSRKRRKNIS